MAGKSAKSIADGLLKKKMNSSSQLSDNISKFEFGLSVKQRELQKIKAKRLEIKQEAKEVSHNKTAQGADDEINTFLEKYKVLQNYFENEFKSVINQANMSDVNWSARLVKLGFKPSCEIVGVSFLKPGNLGSLSIEALIERIQNLRGYGPPLLDIKDRNLQPSMQVQRDTYFGYEKP